MDFGTFLVRTLADILYNTPPSFATKDIYKEIKGKINSKNIGKITKCVLKEMFCENTGTHICDSGGAYGRAWQRNQEIKDQDWDNFPYTHVEVNRYSRRDYEYDFYVMKNTYQFLVEHLHYDVKMDEEFHAFCNDPERSDDVYYQNMREFRDHMKDKGFELYCGANTYNGESCLDTILQFDIFRREGRKYINGRSSYSITDFIVLQTHNGCDVRGGYSTPHVFSLDADNFLSMMDDLVCACPNRYEKDNETTVQLDLDGNKAEEIGHVDCYSDDCGYHWYNNYNGNNGSRIKDGAEFITDEDGEHHIICKKCKEELVFY